MRDKQPVKVLLLPDDHEGGEQEVEVLPPENAMLFSSEDIDTGLEVYRKAAMGENGNAKVAIREVMMFALRIAAINLGVR